MRYFILIVLLICHGKATSQIKQDKFAERTSWLLGSWAGKHNGAPFYEAWRMRDNTLVNFTIEIKKGDTLVIEQTSLRTNNDKIVFGKKGDWLLKRLTRNEIVLENDSSKYSNRIIYLHLDNDHWFTVLESPDFTMYFDMERFPALETTVDRFIRNKKK